MEKRFKVNGDYVLVDKANLIELVGMFREQAQKNTSFGLFYIGQMQFCETLLSMFEQWHGVARDREPDGKHFPTLPVLL